jgi:hypothetical protein
MVSQAKRNPVKGCTTYYVSSSSTPGKKYMVLLIKMGRRFAFFCQCDDFFGRRLPHIGANTFSCCKHINQVKESL